MKVYVNRKPVTGPWGGGNKIVTSLCNALKVHGHTVVHRLEPDIDVLVCFDPRPGSESGLEGYQAIYQYAHGHTIMKRPDEGQPGRPLIVQRVGDIGTHGKPDLSQLVIDTVMHSDTVIFPSTWAHDAVQYALELRDTRPTKQWHIIPNAPSPVFLKHRIAKDVIPTNVSFVTHHWSTNEKKGFAFYEALQRWCKDHGHTFSYFGRAPAGFIGGAQLDALPDNKLAEELPKHDVYVTASLHEAGANHVLEAIAAGLPVIYHRDGGSISEYCAQFGAAFDGSLPSFEMALEHVRAANAKVKRNIKKYRQTVDDVAQKYVAIIEGLRNG